MEWLQEECVKHAGFAVGVALALGVAADAWSEEAAAPPPAPAEVERISRPPVTTTARPPLKLHVGDVRKYMMPNEYRAAINAPDAENTTIIVEGKRPLLPMKSEQPVPGGIMTPFWMIANPLSGWRALLPDLNAPPPGPPDPVPKREFRWGP
jgi:hypothetical protein